MQFADPAWQPGTTQDFQLEQESPAPQPARSQATGAGPSTQSSSAQQAGEAEREYNQGYRAQKAQAPGSDSTFQGRQQPFFQPPLPWYRRLPVWAWWLIGALVLSSIVEPMTSGGGLFGSLFGLLIIACVVVVGWLIYTRRVRVNLAGEAQQAETRTFAVGPLPTISIRNNAGSIRLRAGQEGQVDVTTTKRGYIFHQQLNRDAQVWFNQDQGTNTVSARVDGWKLFGKNSIDFDITVPPHSTLELTTNVGSISIQNIDGQMKLQADAGSIQAEQVHLRGKSTLKTDAGTITFSGSLDPNGEYKLSSDVGNINATLPVGSSFSLNAKTDLGTVTTNLPLAQVKRTKASGHVGSGPYPRLKIETDVGSVQVHCG
jgi:hypothetical protein